jgi:transcriptional/translational regulatory protein YebC/TACO1
LSEGERLVSSFYDAFASVIRKGNACIKADEITFISQTESVVSGDDVDTFDKFMDMLEDCDDVQHVYHNAVVER